MVTSAAQFAYVGFFLSEGFPLRECLRFVTGPNDTNAAFSIQAAFDSI